MNRRSSFVHLLVTLVVCCGLAGASQAVQLPFQTDPVKLETFTSLSSVSAGGRINVAVVLSTQGHWHVNANKTNDEFLIPTTVEFEVPDGISVVGVVYPEGKEKQLGFSEQPMLLYDGTTYIGAVLEASPDKAPGDATITAVVTYQACDNERCIAPTTIRIPVVIPVTPPTEAIDAENPEVFANINFTALTTTPDDAGRFGGRLGDVIAKRGFFFAFVIVFVWGLALNLTPCVYPIVPITVGYFGGQAGGRTIRTVGLAGLYVLGMATMYSVLGTVAALTGSILGTALQNPFVVGFVSLVMVALALSMFGLYEIRMPAALNNLAGSSSSKGGPIGAYLMGLTVGIVAAPCIGPFVLALLTFVGESGNPFLGFLLFFTLALGLGTPFLLLGVLSGSITKLPKSGEWMDWVKRLFGMILLAMAVFFLQPLISDRTYWILISAVIIIGGLVLGFVLKTQMRSLSFMVLRRFVGVAAPAFGIYLLVAPGHLTAGKEAGIVWSAYDDDHLVTARTNEQPVIIDFSAEWCLPCKELDHRTFSPAEVVSATEELMKLRADLTRTGSEEVVRLREQYSIIGVPTVVFLDAKGRERTDLRIFGFVDKDEFLQRVDKLKSGG
jgi:thiol:disulfide interchange protein DsbD